MVRVGVLGAGGRMGREVCAAVEADAALTLVAAVDPRAAGQAASDSVTVAADVHALKESGAEVAVDFTEPGSVAANLAWLADHEIHAVVGTTGLGPEDLEEARRRFARGPANAVIVPNFAIGAVLLTRCCELVAPFMDGVEIVELHHDAKHDAPSGTALHTAAAVAAARRRSGAGAFVEDPTTVETVAGSRGAVADGGVRVHALRLPGLVAHQEVIFGAVGQTLSLRHDATDRRCFMPGVLLAIKAVARHRGVTVGLEDLLGLGEPREA